MIQRLHKLLDVQERGARTFQTVHDLTVLESRTEKMIRDLQVSQLQRALEEKAA